ncbi:unnamed protein product [Symbiodinium natans]|uniref:Uncharacterized protein n=1 Tax=Symbiodinium natans TaxID=878477 RepID=A0A812P839_9DINO|nr:unnamed protein product [Symbiodinium natans]
MACVRKAEDALADSYESVSQTVTYLKQKHDELRSTRGAAALQDLKEQLQNLRVRGTRAQVAHSDVKNKVAEAKNRHDRQLEALKKKRQQAEEKIAADTITGEASSMVDDLVAKATAACAAATNALSSTGAAVTNSAGALQALEQVEKDLQSAVQACQEGEAKIMKTVAEEIRNASKGPLFDARKVMFRLKVKLSPLPNNCKKHLRTIEEKKKEVFEDVRQMVADLLREHAINHDLSSNALFEQLRKGGEGEGEQSAEATALLVLFVVVARPGSQANLTRFAFLDLVVSLEEPLKEVAVTPSLEVKGSTALRKLQLDETVEVLGQHSREEAAGLLRSRCRALQDSLEGRARVNLGQGTPFLKRVAKPYYFCQAGFTARCRMQRQEIATQACQQLEAETSLIETCAISSDQRESVQFARPSWLADTGFYREDSGNCAPGPWALGDSGI